MHSWAEVLHEFANGVPDAGQVIPTNEGNDILQSWQQSFLMTDAQQDRRPTDRIQACLDRISLYFKSASLLNLRGVFV